MAIRFLSPEDAQKVAAGEVVERPANIIKELIENSIDAQASRIELSLKQGGKTSLTITDNGIGMTKDDARLCFERHATSKLSSFDDLPDVATFGFRGEALASVCAVAKVTLTTKTHDALEGLRLTIQEGKIISHKAVAAPQGTTFVVEDLFYNIPARKKFLKTTATEFHQITTLFKAFCLTYPTIHFTLHHDDTLIYNCPPTKSLKNRVGQLFDPAVFSCAQELVSFEEKGITVTGLITTPQYSRYDRGGLYFFVNNRLVKNYQLARAVMKGFGSVLPAQKYPMAVIHLTLDPHTVDVNIHPKKEEVLFLHPHLVEQAITKAVSYTLEQHLSQNLQRTAPTMRENFFPTPTTPPPFFAPTIAPSHRPSSTSIPFFVEKTIPLALEPAFPEELPFVEENLSATPEPSYRIIGQFDTTYLLLEHKDGLLLIDQHAAHERILYERFGNNFGKTETIQLLFPLIVTLSFTDLELLAPYHPLLQEHGICVEQFGPEQLRVTALPAYAKNVSVTELIQELLGWIKENGAQPTVDLFKILTEKMRAQLACKAAVKAGDTLSREAMEQLLKDLEKTNNRFSCPHGRPTQWLISSSEIERKFKRIV